MYWANIFHTLLIKFLNRLLEFSVEQSKVHNYVRVMHGFLWASSPRLRCSASPSYTLLVIIFSDIPVMILHMKYGMCVAQMFELSQSFLFVILNKPWIIFFFKSYPILKWAVLNTSKAWRGNKKPEVAMWKLCSFLRTSLQFRTYMSDFSHQTRAS